MDMELINALPNIDKGTFYEYTGDYCRCVEDFKYRAPVETLLAEWDDKKSKLFEVFHKQFILEKEINYQKSEDDMHSCLTDFYSTKTFNCFRDWVYSYCKNFPTKENEDPYQHPLYYKILHLADFANFVDNMYHGETFSIPIPESENQLVCTHGMKIMKLIQKIYRKFINMFDGLTPEEVEKDIIVYSQCLNEKTLKGTLCLSIHPLDFITASDNNCGWDSCMTYCGDGDYRRGIVEMMNSPIVVCAYLKSKEDMVICGQPWSNKKWREFFIVRDDIIAGIKGYPYWNKELEEMVLNWLKELMSDYYKVTYSDTITFSPHFRNAAGQLFQFSTSGNAMYNDFYSSNTYICCITPAFDYETVHYPGEATCLFCGEVTKSYNFSMTNNVCCSSCGCEGDSYCECCGDSYNADELTEVDGEYWCDYCVEQRANYSDVGGQYHITDDVYEVNLASREKQCGFYSGAYRFWNYMGSTYSNDFSEMPYPVYQLSDGTYITFIEDIAEYDCGRTLSIWLGWDAWKKDTAYDPATDKDWQYHGWDISEEIANGLDLIHEGKVPQT